MLISHIVFVLVAALEGFQQNSYPKQYDNNQELA